MRKMIRAFTTVKILQQLGSGWHFGTYVLFLLSHKLTLADATRLNFVFMITIFLLDPYTGYLADRIGQKKVYITGQFLWSAGMLVYGLGASFSTFMVAEFIAALGYAFMSEALESWLRNNVSERVTHTVLSNTGTIVPLTTIPAAIGGSIMGVAWGLQWPWIIGSLTGLVGVLVSYLMLRDLPDSFSAVPAGKISSIRTIVKSLASMGQLRFVAVVTLLSTLAFQPLNMFWQPIFSEMSGQNWWLGFVWVGVAGLTATGSYLAKTKLMPRNGSGIAAALFIMAIPLLFAVGVPVLPVTLLGFFVHEIGRGAIRPLLFSYSNRYIQNASRSTANSILGSVATFGAATGLLVSGELTKFLSPLSVWGIAGVLILALGFYAWSQRHTQT